MLFVSGGEAENYGVGSLIGKEIRDKVTMFVLILCCVIEK